jgi:hypothetical protein
MNYNFDGGVAGKEPDDAGSSAGACAPRSFPAKKSSSFGGNGGTALVSDAQSLEACNALAVLSATMCTACAFRLGPSSYARSCASSSLPRP